MTFSYGLVDDVDTVGTVDVNSNPKAALALQIPISGKGFKAESGGELL
jgi:hypothetical protein